MRSPHILKQRHNPHRVFLVSLLFLGAFSAGLPSRVQAQTFQTIPSLYFTKAYAGADPLPQVIGVASTGANFNEFPVAVSLTGGNWLTITNNNYCCLSTPQTITVSANPSVTLAAGTYTGQITVSSQDGGTTMIIPVTLTIEPSTAAFFDDLSGGLTYSMVTDGNAPPAEPLQIRNAGEGTLTWTASASTADGGGWLTLSAASGTAPSILNVSINPAKLPGQDLTPGTFTGEVVLRTSGDRVTVPVTVTVGASVFSQVNPLNFTKVYAGGNPLSQVITIASTGTNFTEFPLAVSSTGGDWLTITNNNYCCLSTPQVITVSANPTVTLAAGTYSSEIIVQAQDGTKAMVVPVTLTIEQTPATFFDALPGELTFSMVTNGNTPPAQPLQIRNAGEGTLDWTASASTADGGGWLTLSAASGTAPSILNVSINPAKLPGQDLTPGTFTGEVVLQTSGDRVTVPVTVTVGASVFSQVNPLNFTKVYAGGNPLSQVITIASTGTNFTEFPLAVSSTGGDWLTITNNNYCCLSTPQVITVSANPTVTLAAGTYSSEIIVQAQDGTKAMVVPVTLTIEQTPATFFDALPGELTFSMVTNGNTPPAQPLQIRNAGEGTLDWTASASTADGGGWLTLSAASGTAPSILNVSINPAKLPGQDLTPGTFTGEVVLQTSGDRVTVPVTVTVGASVFSQVNPLNFTKVYAGGNPLSQVITIASTGTNFTEFPLAVSSTGGDWLTITNNNYCCLSTPQVITVSANPTVTLAAGTYSSEIIVQAQDGTKAMVVPVTLTIEQTPATFFDALPGELTFSMVTNGNTPPAQPLQIRNAGEGTLDWTASASTADGGGWLTLSAASGTAPSILNVSINPAKLPGQDLTPGTFTGEVVLQTSGDRVTVPVTVTIGASVFSQLAALSFTKQYQGANPSSQTITIASTGQNFNVVAVAASSTGGSWLAITNNNNCCYSTPFVVTVSANPDVTLVPGIYSAEIIVTDQNASESMLIPVSLTINGTDAAATPVFTPPGGTYSATQSVVITDSTPDSAIHYTTDGSTPTASSPIYSKPVTVAATETVQAIATATGYLKSAVGIAVYTITGPVAATPSPSEMITIADTTPGAIIHYTTDGSTPTASSPIYTVPLVLDDSSVLKFVAIAPGYSPSAVRTISTTIH